jgi:pyrroloquinoline quinone biosynthesis protein E
LTGDAVRADPACALSPDHALMAAAVEDARKPPPDFVYRGFAAAVPAEA